MRSVTKGPYIESSLLEKVKRHISANKKTAIKTKSRRSTIIADFVGLKFDVHNGKKYTLVHVNQNMVGHKLGEFSHTRTFTKHAGTKSTIKPIKKKKK